jgi:predicted aspartyl protease
VASELNLGKNRLSIIKSTSANGTQTDALLTKIDLIEVGDKLQANAEVLIMPVRSEIGADGLLGNSFLKFYNFSIDYDNRLLRWNEGKNIFAE